MANEKHVLSDTYHSHKRTSLITSGALFLTSLPGVKLASTLFGVIDTGPLPSFARGLLALGSVYYLVNFLLIWAIERGPYERAQDVGEADLLKAIAPTLKSLEHQVATTKNVSEEIARECTRIAETSGTMAVAIDWAAIDAAIERQMGEAVDRWDAASLQAIKDAIEHLTSQVVYDVALTRAALLATRQRLADEIRYSVAGYPRAAPEIWPDLVANGETFAKLRDNLVATLADVKSMLSTNQVQLRKLRNDLRLGPWSRTVLLWGVDLTAPLLVFLIAGAHFIGSCMRHPWFWDAATRWTWFIAWAQGR